MISMAQASAMLMPLIFDVRAASLGCPGAVAFGADGEGHGALHEGADVRLQPSTSLARNDFWIRGISPS